MKSGRYLKYAFGEIILVVIGILIALTINSWNEHRKSNTLEKEILTEMHGSLLKDHTLLEVIGHRLDQKDSAINIILNSLDNNQDLAQEQSDQLITQTLLRVTLSYDVGPYEALIASGLETVKNKNLRSQIIRFYKVTLPRNEQFIEGLKNEYKPKTIRLIEEANHSGLIKSEFIKNENGAWDVRPKPDLENIFKSKLWSDIMINESNLTKNIRFRLEPLTRQSKGLIDSIAVQIYK